MPGMNSSLRFFRAGGICDESDVMKVMCTLALVRISPRDLLTPLLRVILSTGLLLLR